MHGAGGVFARSRSAAARRIITRWVAVAEKRRDDHDVGEASNPGDCHGRKGDVVGAAGGDRSDTGDGERDANDLAEIWALAECDGGEREGSQPEAQRRKEKRRERLEADIDDNEVHRATDRDDES